MIGASDSYNQARFATKQDLQPSKICNQARFASTQNLRGHPNLVMVRHAMTQHFHTQDDLARALEALLEQDPRLRPLLAQTGMPTLRRRDSGFAGLAAVICGQQLSTKAAAAIWARVTTAFDPFHHETIRRARADRLGRLGLSAAKIKTLKFIAGEIANGRLDLMALAQAPADDAHIALTALHGIGPWTADVYLLFCLGHGDAWPAGDLAIQEAIKIAFGLPTRPTAKQMADIGNIWRPWRGAAAHLFWAYYRVVKSPGFEAVLPPDTPKQAVPKESATKPPSKTGSRPVKPAKPPRRAATTRRP
jgi:DNA-3-methyladenine glycosylase II